MWTCRCGEENERQFAWCWQCGRPRPETPAGNDPPPAPDDAEGAPTPPPRLTPRHAPKAFLLWCGSMFAVGFVLGPFARGNTAWISVAGPLLAAFLLVWLMTKGHGIPWREVLPTAVPDRGTVFASGILALGATLVAIWMIDLVSMIPWVAEILVAWPANPSTAQLADLSPLAAFLSAGVGVPFSEELVFRGVILTALLANWSARRSVVVTALLFAVLHVHPVSVTTAFVLGILAGWQRVVFGTIWLPILTHMVFNAHALAWGFSPWMPDLSPITWVLIGVGLTFAGYDLSWRRRPGAPADIRAEL